MTEDEDKSLYPNGYWIRTLNTLENNYATQQREWFAMVWAILLRHVYLNYICVPLLAYHAVLKWVQVLKIATSALPRWPLHLLKFDSDVMELPGVPYHAPDALSWPFSDDVLLAPSTTTFPR